MIVYARSPQEIDRQRRIEKDAEHTEISPRFQQKPSDDGTGPLCDAYKAWMRNLFARQLKPGGRLT